MFHLLLAGNFCRDLIPISKVWQSQYPPSSSLATLHCTRKVCKRQAVHALDANPPDGWHVARCNVNRIGVTAASCCSSDQFTIGTSAVAQCRCHGRADCVTPFSCQPFWFSAARIPDPISQPFHLLCHVGFRLPCHGVTR